MKTQKIIELEKERDNALERAKVYKGLTDGSYEMALDTHGYYKAVKELKELGVMWTKNKE